MPKTPVFLSVVIVVRNQAGELVPLITRLSAVIGDLVTDYEIVVVDNGSDDESAATFRTITQAEGLPNLQIFSLIKEVDGDTATWVGLENALGDFVVVVDPFTDDISMIPAMLDQAVGGVDVVFARNRCRPRQGIAYSAARIVFDYLYKWLNGIHLLRDAPSFRLLSRRVINLMLQYAQPLVAYRHLPATGGFAKSTLEYSFTGELRQKYRLMDGIDRGIRLLVSSTRAPMRIVTTLCLFGAAANVFYSGYVVAVAILKTDVAAGWVSISLQQSGMFFLLSLVLWIVGEYILNMVSLANEGPLYHVGHEFTSARMTRKERLNVEDSGMGRDRSASPQ